ncbi:MAG: DUF2326 domain-containing protein [Methylotenera sp.]|nr:DUF2326 domain-containing protein [Methylotenera sp.]MDP1958916.1 DUF2326 domain-containing protein [Methylotenera sp.]MDP3943530.1 DUF2326 domain-containing protein [Methylotenera sp.]
MGTIGDSKARSKQQTYNGVGKSLIIELIHFCLGSSPNDAFEKLLPGWEFTLTISHNDIEHIITRSTKSQKVVSIDDAELSLEVFRDKLQSYSFKLDVSIDHLSFRALIGRFIRRNLSDYVDPLKLSNDFTDFATLLKTAFLLGIDLQLILKKYVLKTELKRIQGLSKNFRDDTLIREFFIKNKDEEIELKFLEEKIEGLENARSNFKVADNYYEIENQANELKEHLTELRNQSIVTKNSIAAIEKSMKIRPDIPAQKLIKAYDELLESFKEGVIQKLEDVETFHNSLMKNRLARLSQEKIRLLSKLKDCEKQLVDMHSELDNLISYLGTNKALDELNAISNQIGELKAKAQKIRDYQALNKQYKIDIAAIKSTMNSQIELSYQYLDDTKLEFEKNIDSVYRNFVKHFYPNSPAGISVRNNDKDNQTRFDIDVKIENQASDGINHVRIFCFDLLILMAGVNHDIEFIFHDSRLYDGVDPRQRIDMLRLANQLSIKNNKQYIVTLNQDHIDSMGSHWIENEYDSLISKNITLKLADDSDSSRLLGEQIDMNY